MRQPERPLPRPLLRELRRIVGEAFVTESAASSELYAYDGSLARGAPGAVVFPADARQTAAVVRAAARAGVPFVPRGFGTNLSGGTVLPQGGLVVCLARLNRILALSIPNRSAVVQPGVTNLELQQALAPLGFFYAPDPASQKVATLGGNVGENSGGPRCVKYGVTVHHVLGLEIVTAEGELRRLGGEAPDPPGPDLRGLLIGSEGALAVVTEITVRILPRPEAVRTWLAVYDSVEAAAQTVAEIIAAGILPAALEMMDTPVMRAVEESRPCGFPPDAAAVLLIEVEGLAAGLDRQAGRIREICRRHGVREIREASGEEERARLWEGRRGAFGAVARLAPNYLVNDCTVPRTRLPEALRRVEAIARAHGILCGNVFHAGDGNLHPLLLFDSRRPDEVERVHRAGEEILTACVELGGTISGEHGIGLEKRQAMRLVFTEEELSLQRDLKRAFDPQGRLNPGKLFPPPTEAPGPKRAADALCPAEEDLARRVRQAFAAGERLRIRGSGSLDAAPSGGRDDRPAVSTASLTAIVEFDPENQFFTAGAGLSLARAQEALAARNQWLPLRPPPLPGRRTLGGIVATAAAGPERSAYGSPRELLLGVGFVDGRGRRLRAGGRVVKNVAGYDVTRLLVGSAGRLALLTRLTFRTATRPERCTAIAIDGDLAALARLAGRLLASPLEAVIAAAAPGPGGSFRLWLGFEGFAETVARQIEEAARKARAEALAEVGISDYGLLDGPFPRLYEEIAKRPGLLRIGVPPEQAARAARHIASRFPEAPLWVDFAAGRVMAGMDGLDPDLWAELRRAVSACGGHLTLEKAPASDFSPGGGCFPRAARDPLDLRLRAAFDPRGVFAGADPPETGDDP
ncbi:MAG: FAD-linked oxidase C-terminal domain-containing protein [Desulfobacterales bacterium]